MEWEEKKRCSEKEDKKTKKRETLTCDNSQDGNSSSSGLDRSMINKTGMNSG